jgi:hypothetical protein
MASQQVQLDTSAATLEGSAAPDGQDRESVSSKQPSETSLLDAPLGKISASNESAREINDAAAALEESAAPDDGGGAAAAAAANEQLQGAPSGAVGAAGANGIGAVVGQEPTTAAQDENIDETTAHEDGAVAQDAMAGAEHQSEQGIAEAGGGAATASTTSEAESESGSAMLLSKGHGVFSLNWLAACQKEYIFKTTPEKRGDETGVRLMLLDITAQLEEKWSANGLDFRINETTADEEISMDVIRWMVQTKIAGKYESDKITGPIAAKALAFQ